MERILCVALPDGGSLCLDAYAGCVCVDGVDIPLTPVQHKILFALVSASRQILSNEQIGALLPGSATGGNVRQHITSLRVSLKRIAGLKIVTQHGVGYRVCDADGNRLRVTPCGHCPRELDRSQ